MPTVPCTPGNPDTQAASVFAGGWKALEVIKIRRYASCPISQVHHSNNSDLIIARILSLNSLSIRTAQGSRQFPRPFRPQTSPNDQSHLLPNPWSGEWTGAQEERQIKTATFNAHTTIAGHPTHRHFGPTVADFCESNQIAKYG